MGGAPCAKALSDTVTQSRAHYGTDKNKWLNIYGNSDLYKWKLEIHIWITLLTVNMSLYISLPSVNSGVYAAVKKIVIPNTVALPPFPYSCEGTFSVCSALVHERDCLFKHFSSSRVLLLLPSDSSWVSSDFSAWFLILHSSLSWEQLVLWLRL